MDHRSLLIKYVRYVVDVEGTDFIQILDRRYESDAGFTDQEWKELEAIAREVEATRKNG